MTGINTARNLRKRLSVQSRDDALNLQRESMPNDLRHIKPNPYNESGITTNFNNVLSKKRNSEPEFNFVQNNIYVLPNANIKKIPQE